MATKNTTIFISKIDSNKDLYLEIKTTKGRTIVNTFKLEESNIGIYKSFDISGKDIRSYSNRIQRATDKALQTEHDSFLKAYADMDEPYSVIVKNHFRQQDMERLAMELNEKRETKTAVCKV